MACVQTHPSALVHPVSLVLSEEHLRDPLCSLCKWWRWCFVTWEFSWQIQIGAPPFQLLVPVPLLHCPSPVPYRTSGQQAGPCFEVKSRVTFSPALGQRSSLQLCQCICGGSGVERGSPFSQLHGWSCNWSYHTSAPGSLAGVSRHRGCWKLWCKTTSGQWWIPRRGAASLLLK